ncbi:pilus assembly protein [Alphaproteobacteria bacterium]|nr:pilus assembly protein [Alphaproteobacteria bacterium]
MLIQQIQKWLKDSSGTTAIEFALLAIPFFTLTLAIIEMAIMFTTASVLEGATGSTARLIRTGQIQQGAANPTAQEEMFRDAFCGNITALVKCSDVEIEVVNMGSFGSYNSNLPQFDGNGDLVSRGFDAGGVSDVILIRAGYRYRLMTPFVNMLLGEGSTGTRYFMSTIVLQTEPYEFVGEEA